MTNLRMNMNNIPNNSSIFSRVLLVCIALIIITGLISAAGFWILPMFGIAIAITAGTWGIVIASIVMLSIALLLFFIIPFFLILLISVSALVWVLGVLIFFPITFPIVIPLFIILLCVAYMRKK